MTQTTVRMTHDAWAKLQQRALDETIRDGRKRFISDVIADALEAYYADRGPVR
jgi:hypothetical protein